MISAGHTTIRNFCQLLQMELPGTNCNRCSGSRGTSGSRWECRCGGTVEVKSGCGVKLDVDVDLKAKVKVEVIKWKWLEVEKVEFGGLLALNLSYPCNQP